MLHRAFALLLLLVAPAQAFEDVVADLSQNRVSITTSFDGSEILIFGAVKRNTPVPIGSDPLQVIITVTGPSEPVTVRRKDRRFGIWVNTDSVAVDEAPAFYAVASSVPLSVALSETEDTRHKVSVERAIRNVGETTAELNSGEFTEALIRIRETSGAYMTASAPVEVVQETLFSTEVSLPANLVEGDYAVRIFLTRGGAVTALYNDSIVVSKVGLERFIYNLAHERPLVYGLLSLAIAIAAGWGASAIFRVFRA